ncbi:MAG TPA: DUF4474 domain-containing protein [Clostridia bacterium]|nr:DUF4474 domain-containing protein [Clostridia bacterium]
MFLKRILSASMTVVVFATMFYSTATLTVNSAEITKVTVKTCNLKSACEVSVTEKSIKAPQSTAVENKKTQAVSKNIEKKSSENTSGEIAEIVREYIPDVIYTIIEGIRILSNGMNNTIAYLSPAQDDPYFEFIVDYYDNDGNHHIVPSGVYFDDENRLIFGKYDTGVYDSSFNLDAKNIVFYTARKAWQRSFGFCEIYDVAAQWLTFDYVTERIKFTYDGKDWMYQFWKGRYNAFLRGGEIGIYTKPQGRETEFYDCAHFDDMMPMSIKVYTGDYVYLDRPLEEHWWATGFKLGGPIVAPEKLTLEGALVFKNEEMRDLFLSAVSEQVPDMEVTVNGFDVSIKW